jgi:hypothetical protein
MAIEMVREMEIEIVRDMAREMEMAREMAREMEMAIQGNILTN